VEISEAESLKADAPAPEVEEVRQDRLETEGAVDAELVETKDTSPVVEEAGHGRLETQQAGEKPAPTEAHTSTELMEKITGTAVDSPLCFTCGTKMRPAGSCYVCEGCGSTSGCS